MGSQAWLVIATIAVLLVGFPMWLLGHFLRARREAAASILRRGRQALAEVIEVDGSTARFRFSAQGWEQPIVATAKLPANRRCAVGERIAIRYLPTHPHLSVIEPEPQ